MKFLQQIASASPMYLYHGSGFKQTELKPGYQYTKKLVTWDGYESNAFLYATTDKQEAMLLGISSKWEKEWTLKTTNINHDNKTIDLCFEGKAPSIKELYSIDCWLYTILYEPHDWIKNRNPYNGIDTEYKTKQTIRDISDVQKIDVEQVLKSYQVNIT